LGIRAGNLVKIGLVGCENSSFLRLSTGKAYLYHSQFYRKRGALREEEEIPLACLTFPGGVNVTEVSSWEKEDSGVSPSEDTFPYNYGKGRILFGHPGSFQPRISPFGRITTGLFEGNLEAFFRRIPF